MTVLWVSVVVPLFQYTLCPLKKLSVLDVDSGINGLPDMVQLPLVSADVRVLENAFDYNFDENLFGGAGGLRRRFVPCISIYGSLLDF